MGYTVQSVEVWASRETDILNAVRMTFINGGYSFWFDGIERCSGYSVGNNNDPIVRWGESSPENLQNNLRTAWRDEVECNDPEDREYDGVGTWIDESTGELFLDNIRHIENLDDAIALARLNGERAIYDIKNEECIEIVPETSRTLEEIKERDTEEYRLAYEAAHRFE